jgi:hypothetical protein
MPTVIPATPEVGEVAEPGQEEGGRWCEVLCHLLVGPPGLAVSGVGVGMGGWGNGRMEDGRIGS